jgi:hypothetical protein
MTPNNDIIILIEKGDDANGQTENESSFEGNRNTRG